MKKLNKYKISAISLTFAFMLILALSYPAYAAGEGGIDWSIAGAGKFIWPIAAILAIVLIAVLTYNVKIDYTLVDETGQVRNKTMHTKVWGSDDNLVINFKKALYVAGATGVNMPARNMTFIAPPPMPLDMQTEDVVAAKGEITFNKALTKRMKNKTVVLKFKGADPISVKVDRFEDGKFKKKFELS